MTTSMKIKMTSKEIKRSFKVICIYKDYFCYHHVEFFDVPHKDRYDKDRLISEMIINHS